MKDTSAITRLHDNQDQLAKHVRNKRLFVKFDYQREEVLNEGVGDAQRRVNEITDIARSDTHFRKALRAFTGFAHKLLAERNQQKIWRPGLDEHQDENSVKKYEGYTKQFKNENDYMLRVHLRGQADFFKDHALAESPEFKVADRYASGESYAEAIKTLEDYRSKLQATFHDDCASLDEYGKLTVKVADPAGGPPTTTTIDVTTITNVAQVARNPHVLDITQTFNAGNVDERVEVTRAIKQNIVLTTDGSRISPDRIDFVKSERPLKDPTNAAASPRTDFQLKLKTGSSFVLKDVHIDPSGISEAKTLHEELLKYQEAQIRDLQNVLRGGDQATILQTFDRVKLQDRALLSGTDHIAQFNSPTEDKHTQAIRDQIDRIAESDIHEIIDLSSQLGVRSEKKELNDAGKKLSEAQKKHAEDTLEDPRARNHARRGAKDLAKYEHPLSRIPNSSPNLNFEAYVRFIRADQAGMRRCVINFASGGRFEGTINQLFETGEPLEDYGSNKHVAWEAAAKAYNDQMKLPPAEQNTRHAIAEAIGPKLVNQGGVPLSGADINGLAGKIDEAFRANADPHIYNSNEYERQLRTALYNRLGNHAHNFADPRNVFWQNKFDIHAIDYEMSQGNHAGAATRIEALTLIDRSATGPFQHFFANNAFTESTKAIVRAEIDFQNQAIQNLKSARLAFLRDNSSAVLENTTSDVINQIHKSDYDQNRAVGALRNDARTADQRRGDLRLMIMDRDEVLHAVSEVLPGLDEKVNHIQTKLDQHIKDMYKNSKDASPVGIAQQATLATDAAVELAPLVVQQRIDRLNKEGRKAEADRLIEDRFKEEKRFEGDFKSFYEQEMLRYVQMERLEIADHIATRQMRLAIMKQCLLFAATNATQSGQQIAGPSNILTSNVFTMATRSTAK